MKNIEERIVSIKDDDMYWDWDKGTPSFYTKTPDSQWGIHINFDPFPCYAHNRDLVIKEVMRIESLFPIPFNTFYFIFGHEPIGRTNGQAYKNTIEYKDEENGKKEVWDGVVDLYGKRIPPHPAMTRYLISHEYGHIVDDWICRERELDCNGLDEEYSKMRGLEINQKYGGRKWHTNIGEIIANDFRVCIGNTEIEFWPHECKHPLECQNVIDFWKEMKDKYSYE